MNFVFDFQMLYLGVGLLGLVLINILLGSINSILERKFDKKIFINGIIKGFIVVVSFIGVYGIGLINSEIYLDINGQQLTLLMAVNTIVLGGFVFYGKEVMVKLANFVNAKFINE
jgi:small basic protein